jgi:uncharacterized RDD family membrane protein YckC
MANTHSKKLFISYRSSDADKVDAIVQTLKTLQHDDATLRYTTWQDKKDLPPASPHWWDAIVDAIEACDVFVFHLSRASLQSQVCRAELDYAKRRNRPIIPVVLDGEFWLNPQTRKYDLPAETWPQLPDWLREAQLLFYLPDEFVARFQSAITQFERNWPRDIPAPRPLNPDSNSAHGSNHALYEQAVDYAQRAAFGESEKLFEVLLRRNDADYADLSALWLNITRRYAELIDMVAHDSPAVVFRKKWEAYQALFPNDALEQLFDPQALVKHEQLRQNADESSVSAVNKPTPPSIGLAKSDLQPAFGRRLLAAGLDIMLSSGLLLLFLLVYISIIGQSASSPNETTTQLLTAIAAIIIFGVIPQLLQGQTVGKVVFGLRVVQLDGQPATRSQILLRYTVGYLASILSLYFGFLWVFFNEERRGFHDFIAGTRVVLNTPNRPADNDDDTLL